MIVKVPLRKQQDRVEMLEGDNSEEDKEGYIIRQSGSCHAVQRRQEQAQVVQPIRNILPNAVKCSRKMMAFCGEAKAGERGIIPHFSLLILTIEAANRNIRVMSSSIGKR
jgi:hypothetical protein